MTNISTHTPSDPNPPLCGAMPADGDGAPAPGSLRAIALGGDQRSPTRRRASTPGSLPEFKLYQPKPGHPDWPRLAAKAKELAAELRPKLVRPRRDVAHYARISKAYRTLARNYLHNRELSRQGREDLRPLYFVWTMLRSCNFRCEYCDDHRGRKYPDMSDDGVLDTQQAIELLRIMRTSTPSVYFSGGEPTIRQDLPEITRAAHAMGYYPIIINTNEEFSTHSTAISYHLRLGSATGAAFPQGARVVQDQRRGDHYPVLRPVVPTALHGCFHGCRAGTWG